MDAKRKIVLFIVLSVILSACMITWNPARKRSEAAREQFWTEKANNENTYQVVVYGDSRTYKGFNTPYFEDQRFESVYNFGFSSGSMSSRMLDFVEKRVDFNAQYPIVILGFSPYQFTQDAQKDEQFLQERKRSMSSQWIRIQKGRYLGRFDPISPSDLFGFDHNLQVYHSGGFVEVKNIRQDTLSGLQSYQKSLSNNPLVPNAYETVYDFVSGLSKKGVKVVGCRVPTMISMQQLEDDMTGFNEASFSEAFKRSGGQWISLDTKQFETYDGSHLTHESSIELTKKLIEEIF